MTSLRTIFITVLLASGCRTARQPVVNPPLAQTPPVRAQSSASPVSSGQIVRLAEYEEDLPHPFEKTSPTSPAAKPDLVRPVRQDPTRPQLGLQPIKDAEEPRATHPLSLNDVTESVYFAYPGLEAAKQEMEIAAGKEQTALGEFDLKLKLGSQSDPLGFYRTYKNAVKLEQPMWAGGGVYGQYRLGRGSYPTWDGLETDDGGEFKVGILHPLLQNASIDQRRADVMRATLRRQQVDPAVRALILDLVRDGSEAYWSWLASGRSYEVQRDLLRVTVERNKVFEGRVKAGDLPRIELVQNQRLIAAREAKLVEADRKLQQSAIKLSLYLRDDSGNPLVPTPDMLPASFPSPRAPTGFDEDAAVADSLSNRPELQEIDLLRKQVEVDLTQAENLLLPDLTATVDAAKDVGVPTAKGDKTPFQLQAGLYFDVPLQRNKAHGKIREGQGKLAQLAAKRRLLENKITVEVQDSLSALRTSHARYQRALENSRLAWELAAAERQRFESQDSDLLRVAIQESAAIEAALGEIDALADFFKAEAAYRASIAADPLLEQIPTVEPLPEMPPPVPADR